MIGRGLHHVNIKDGKRHGANEAYIEPICGKRPNFTLSRTRTRRGVFNGTRARAGISAGERQDRGVCDKEVIVLAQARLNRRTC